MVCPDANTLFAMVDPASNPTGFRQLEAHIDDCEACRKAVAALAQGSRPPQSAAAASPWKVDPDRERYAVEAVLGQGGMGNILSAFDRQLHRKVALKELRVQKPELEARFRREALLTARLEHPNIVSMHEAGTWPSGEPFYTMRLVSGRPLDRVIAAAKTLVERLALLPHAIAVADALAYAHQEQIIHRDLKPHNVMVGEFGETVVIDWGLAKDLADAGEEPESASTEPALVGATEAGEVMGTPAYMPPEQAEGNPVDTRADVYAIGAILYHLLAGVPPYDGKTSLEVVIAVRERPPIPLGDRQPGVPRDLLAIIARAMARDPAARYPTARSLAEDLRRFQTGQLVAAHRYSPAQLLRRWLARHRTAVSVAGAALVFLAIVAIVSVQRIMKEQHRVEAARALAEQHRGEAEDLTRFMLVDLKDKLQPLGKLELLDAVAKKATVYYASEPIGRSDDERRERAVVHRNLGDVLKEQGDTAGALAEYRAALAIREELAARDPANVEVQRDLATNHGAIGDVFRAQGRTADALAECRTSLAIRDRIAAQDPTNADRQRDVSISHDKIGNLLATQGDAAGALAEYRAALQIRQRQIASGGDEAKRDLSVSHSKVGEVLLEQGDSVAALTEFQASLAIREQLTAHDPSNAEWMRDLSVSHDNIGDILREHDAAGALAEYREALVIADRLAEHDPTNASWQRDLAVAHAKVGEMLQATNNVAAALVEFRAALEIATRLVKRDPANAEAQRDFVIMHERIGDALLIQKDSAGALAEFRVVLPIKERLAAHDPTNADLQHDLSVSHTAIGDILKTSGNPAGALAEYRAELPIAAKIAERDPSNAGWQHDLSISHRNLGDALKALGKSTEALAEYREALEIAERPAAQDPTNTQWKADLATLHHAVESLARR
jgi:tetratricopeptide (TPR) repeat protein